MVGFILKLELRNQNSHREEKGIFTDGLVKFSRPNIHSWTEVGGWTKKSRVYLKTNKQTIEHDINRGHLIVKCVIFSQSSDGPSRWGLSDEATSFQKSRPRPRWPAESYGRNSLSVWSQLEVCQGKIGKKLPSTENSAFWHWKFGTHHKTVPRSKLCTFGKHIKH